MISRDQRVEVEGAVGAQGGQGLIGEGEGETRGNIGLGGNGQEGGEGAEKNLGLEAGVSKSETDGWLGKQNGTPGVGGTPGNRVWKGIAEQEQRCKNAYHQTKTRTGFVSV